MNVGEAATIVVAVLTCVGSAAAVIFTSGKQIGRVESAIARLVGIEAKLQKVDDHSGIIGTMSEVIKGMRSDHRELKGKLDEVEEKVDRLSERTAEMRGKFQSVHDD